MKKIIITGISGFVGSNLQKYLAPTFQVVPLSVRYKPNQIFDLKGDAIVHLAGKAHDLKKVSNPNDYYQANFELTKQLFDSFLISEATVFVFMSTVKAVADEVSGILYEDVIPNPKTHYGIAKQQAEAYILSQNLPLGKRIYILRPCMIHGPGNKGNLNLLYQVVKKGMPWPLGNFQNQRSFLSIQNLCFVINELINDSNIQSGIYNLADDESLSTNDLIQLIANVVSQKPRILKLPKSLIISIAKIGDKIKLPLNSEKLQKLTEDYVVSNQKIKSVLKINVLPISTANGLKTTIKNFLK